MTDTSCLFCRIVSGEIPATLIAETPHAVAFRDIAPKAPVHVLVIPRRHIGSLAEASDSAELGAVLALAAAVAVQEGVSERGYRVVTNVGEDGGQSVGHLHFHVLGGRALGWPPG
jgi:histidine triad (HIT) family protein